MVADTARMMKKPPWYLKPHTSEPAQIVRVVLWALAAACGFLTINSMEACDFLNANGNREWEQWELPAKYTQYPPPNFTPARIEEMTYDLASAEARGRKDKWDHEQVHRGFVSSCVEKTHGDQQLCEGLWFTKDYK